MPSPSGSAARKRDACVVRHRKRYAGKPRFQPTAQSLLHLARAGAGNAGGDRAGRFAFENALDRPREHLRGVVEADDVWICGLGFDRAHEFAPARQRRDGAAAARVDADEEIGLLNVQ